jgi:hypothetical protein
MLMKLIATSLLGPNDFEGTGVSRQGLRTIAPQVIRHWIFSAVGLLESSTGNFFVNKAVVPILSEMFSESGNFEVEGFKGINYGPL